MSSNDYSDDESDPQNQSEFYSDDPGASTDEDAIQESKDFLKVLKEGPLKKHKSNKKFYGNKSWHTRYLVLKLGRMICYKNARQKRLRTEIVLNSASVVDFARTEYKKMFTFTLHSQGKSLLLGAPTVQEAEDWVVGIRGAISKSKEKESGVLRTPSSRVSRKAGHTRTLTHSGLLDPELDKPNMFDKKSKSYRAMSHHIAGGGSYSADNSPDLHTRSLNRGDSAIQSSLAQQSDRSGPTSPGFDSVRSPTNDPADVYLGRGEQNSNSRHATAHHHHSVEVEGWLWKKHRKNKLWTGWHKRYFVLSGNKVQYFLDGRKRRVRGSVKLGADCRLYFPGSSGGVQLKTPRQRAKIGKKKVKLFPFTIFLEGQMLDKEDEEESKMTTRKLGTTSILLAAPTVEESQAWVNSFQLSIVTGAEQGTTTLFAQDSDEDESMSSEEDEFASSKSARDLPIKGDPVRFGDRIRLWTYSAYTASSAQGGYLGIMKKFKYEKSKKHRDLCVVPPLGLVAGRFSPCVYTIIDPLWPLDWRHTPGSVYEEVRYGDPVMLVDNDGLVWNNSGRYIGPRPRKRKGELTVAFRKRAWGSREGDVVNYGDCEVALDVESSYRTTRDHRFDSYNKRITNYKASGSSLVGGYIVCGRKKSKKSSELHGREITFSIHGRRGDAGRWLDKGEGGDMGVVNSNLDYSLTSLTVIGQRGSLESLIRPPAAGFGMPVALGPLCHLDNQVYVAVEQASNTAEAGIFQLRVPVPMAKGEQEVMEVQALDSNFKSVLVATWTSSGIHEVPDMCEEEEEDDENLGYKGSTRLMLLASGGLCVCLQLLLTGFGVPEASALALSLFCVTALMWDKLGSSFAHPDKAMPPRRPRAARDAVETIEQVNSLDIKELDDIGRPIVKLAPPRYWRGVWDLSVDIVDVKAREEIRQAKRRVVQQQQLLKRSAPDSLLLGEGDISAGEAKKDLLPAVQTEEDGSTSDNSTDSDSEEEEEKEEKEDRLVRPATARKHVSFPASSTSDSNGKFVIGSTMRQDGDAQAWGETDFKLFKCRVGPDYKKNKQKAASGRNFYHPVMCDIFQTVRKVEFMGEHITLDHLIRSDVEAAKLIQAAVTTSKKLADSGINLPPVILFNVMCPNYPPPNPLWGKKRHDGPNNTVLAVFVLQDWVLEASTDAPPFQAIKLLDRFANNDDETFRERWKIITSMANPEDANLNVVETAMYRKFNALPFLVRPQHVFSRGAVQVDLASAGGEAQQLPYFEMTMDTHRFAYMARSSADNITERLPRITIDVGLVLESRENLDFDDMPEQVFACFSLKKLKLKETQKWDCSQCPIAPNRE